MEMRNGQVQGNEGVEEVEVETAFLADSAVAREQRDCPPASSPAFILVQRQSRRDERSVLASVPLVFSVRVANT
jgi:hypothetical protein